MVENWGDGQSAESSFITDPPLIADADSISIQTLGFARAGNRDSCYLLTKSTQLIIIPSSIESSLCHA